MSTATGGFDLLITGATVFDGLGGDGVPLSVGIRGDRIVAIGPDLGAEADAIIDATGLALAPGFIDPHTHSDVVPFMADPQPFKLYQGVTTEVVGNCGNSAAPLSTPEVVAFHRPMSSADKAGVIATPRGFGEYLDQIEAAGPTNHIASLVGHHTLRMNGNGMGTELAEGALDTMIGLADAAFAEGAFGLSTGLIYAPGSSAHEDEVLALAKVAARWQRIYATHMRDEGDGIAVSLAESIGIARGARLPVQISHCKVAGTANHGRAGELLAAIRSARAEGLDVAGDQYPYVTGETFLLALLPSAIQEGGGDALLTRLASPAERARWRDIAERRVVTTSGSPGAWHQTTPEGVTISMHSDQSLQGSTLATYAEQHGLDPWDALCDVVSADPAAMMVYRLMSEDDVRLIMADPNIAIGSDNSIPVGLAHQRAWGCFPTVLGTYSRELGLLSLGEAIRKMTSATADRFGLVDRGRIAVGAIADLVVFDPATVGHPDGSPITPSARPTGISHVLLAGTPVIVDGEFSGARKGRVLRAGFPEPQGAAL